MIGVFRRDDLPASGTRAPCARALARGRSRATSARCPRAPTRSAPRVALSAGCADPTRAEGAARRRPARSSGCRSSRFDEAPGRRVALVARGGVRSPRSSSTPPLTIVLGAEREGLPDEVLAAATPSRRSRLPGGPSRSTSRWPGRSRSTRSAAALDWLMRCPGSVAQHPSTRRRRLRRLRRHRLRPRRPRSRRRSRPSRSTRAERAREPKPEDEVADRQRRGAGAEVAGRA